MFGFDFLFAPYPWDCISPKLGNRPTLAALTNRFGQPAHRTETRMATDSLPATQATDFESSEAIPLFLLDSTVPLQEAPFSLEHLESHARMSGGASSCRRVASTTRRTLDSLRIEPKGGLEKSYEEIVGAIGAGEEITPGAEWLLDNFYVVREHLNEIREDLPRQFYRELPKLAQGPLAGYPRVYALALEIIARYR